MAQESSISYQMAISTKGNTPHTLLKPQLAAVYVRWSISNLPLEYRHSYNITDPAQFAELSVLDDGHYVKDVIYIKCIFNIFHP